MKATMDLQAILLAAANRSGNQSESGFAVEEPQATDCGQWPQDDNPKLPEGYREIRDAIEELLRYAPETTDRETDLFKN